MGSPADIQQCFAFLFLIFAERSSKRFGQGDKLRRELSVVGARELEAELLLQFQQMFTARLVGSA